MRNLRTRYSGSALITGASSGIGKSFTYELAKQGFDLAIVARRQHILEEIKAEVEEKYGVRVWPIQADLSMPDSDLYIKSILDYNEIKIGLLINNAGAGIATPFLEGQRETFVKQIQLNCTSVMTLTHTLLPELMQQEKSGIIFVSSIGAFQALPNYQNYVATKAYDLLLGESLYGELKHKGVDILTVCPGVTETGFHEAAGVRMKKSFLIPVGSADFVVRRSMNALGKKPTLIPGFGNKMIHLASKILPRRVMIYFSRRIPQIERKS